MTKQSHDVVLSKHSFTCYICTDLLTAPLTLPCGHTFCEKCLIQWQKDGKPCPLDGKALPETLPSVCVHLQDLLAQMFADDLASKADRVQRNQAVARLLSLVRSVIMTDGSTLPEHMEAQTQARSAYFHLLKLCLKHRIDLSQGAKARVLAAALARRDKELVEYCLADEATNGLLLPKNTGDVFGFPELLKAVKLLDAPRQIRALEGKLEKLKLRKKVKTNVVGQLKSTLNDLRREEVPEGSVSGSLCQYLKSIIRRIPACKLEFFAMQLPAKGWQELADIVHPHPTKDFQLNWFLPHAFGSIEAPEDSCFALEGLNNENALELISKHKPSYSYLRLKLPELSEEMKLAVAKYSSLDTCLWWHHELASSAVDELIHARLETEDTTLPYGKVMELLMNLRAKGHVTNDEPSDGCLDLVFVMDCTASMGSYIASAQKNVKQIMAQLSKDKQADVRFAIVAYRDHPPQDSTFVTQVYPFSDSVSKMKSNLDKLSASGGGDCPESVADGLFECTELEWREESSKVCMLIADAPPHGISNGHDGFPDGCPKGHDPLTITRRLAEMGVTLYTVGCEPSINPTRPFLEALSFTTGGQYVPLQGASNMASVVVAAAGEEMEMTRLMERFEKDLKKGLDMPENDHATMMFEILSGEDTTISAMEVDGKTLPPVGELAREIASCSKLSQVKELLRKAPVGGSSPTGVYSSVNKPITLDQCKRMVKRARAQLRPPPIFVEQLMSSAQSKLKALELDIEQPVVVFGDASSSMKVAIRTAVIVASVLRVLTEADLRFFDTKSFKLDQVPVDVASVLSAAEKTPARGSTAPAAALLEYYKNKTPVNTFVIVSDEEENRKVEDMYFHEMMRKYCDEVFNARIVLVSFLLPNAEGLMNKRLKSVGLKPIQFRFDARRPDLCKLDSLIGTLALDAGKAQEALRDLVEKDQVAADEKKLAVRPAPAGPGAGESDESQEESDLGFEVVPPATTT